MPILFQYQQLAELPFFGNERTQVDKFDSRIERPDSNFKKAQSDSRATTDLAATTFLAYVQPVPAKERVQADKFVPETQKPTFKLQVPIQQNSWISFVASAPTVNIDSWHPELPRPLFDLRKSQWTYKASAFAGSTAPTVNIDSWWSQDPRITFLTKWDYPNYSAPFTTAFSESSTPDKWHPLVQVPLYDLKRVQYAYQVVATPDQQSLPRVDSWLPEIQRTNFDRSRTQYGYPSTTFSQFQFAESVSADRWVPEIQRPRFDVSRSAYPFLFIDTKQLTQAERSTIDKWWPRLDDKLFDAKRVQFEYQFFVSPDQQQIPDLDSWVAEVKQPQFDLRRNQWDYPSIAFSQIQFGEFPYADKWHPETSRPRFDLQRNQFDYQFFVEPDRQQIPDLDSWFIDLRIIPVRPTATIAPDVPTMFTGETITADKWYATTQVPNVVKSFGHVPLFTAIDTRQLTQVERTTVDKWWPRLDEKVFDAKRTQFTHSNYHFDPFPFPSPIFADRWHPEIIRPRFDLTRAQFEYQFFTEPDRQQFPDLDSWVAEVKQPQFDFKRTQSTYPFLFIDTKQLTLSERLTIDKWWPRLEEKVFDLKRAQFDQPNLSLDPFPFPSPIFTDRWHPEIQRPVFDLKRLQHDYPFIVLPDKQSLPRLDSWVAEIKQPQFDVKRNQWVFPTLFVDTKQLTQAERSTLDKWYPRFDDKVFDDRRTQHTYPDFRMEPFPFPSPIFADSWWQVPNQPLFDKIRRQVQLPYVGFEPISNVFPEKSTVDRWLYDYLFLSQQKPRIIDHPTNPVQVPRQVTVDSWWMEPLRKLFAPIRLNQYNIDLVLDRVQTPERTTIDKWALPLSTPLFDKVRAQYEFNYFSSTLGRFGATPDSWLASQVYPKFDVVRSQYDHEFFVSPERQPEARFDSWFMNAQLPKFLGSLTQPNSTVNWVFVPPVVTTIDEWLGQGRDVMLPYLHLFYDISAVPDLQSEYIVADKWHPEIEQPLFDKHRLQMLYPTLYWLPPVVFIPLESFRKFDVLSGFAQALVLIDGTYRLFNIMILANQMDLIDATPRKMSLVNDPTLFDDQP